MINEEKPEELTPEPSAKEGSEEAELEQLLEEKPTEEETRAMQMVKAFVTKHMKLEMRVEEEEEKGELPTLIISKEINEKIWERGIEKPPRKIRVRAAKDKDGNVTVYLAEGE